MNVQMDDLAWKSRQEGRTTIQAHFLQIRTTDRGVVVACGGCVVAA